MVWGFRPSEIPTWNRKIQLFSQKWIFGGKFELRAMHALMFFVRYRKYGPKKFRNYEKKVVQLLPKLVTKPWKSKFLDFRSVWEGVSCTWVLMHMIKDNKLEFIGQKSKLRTCDAQARYLAWNMKKSEKQYNLIGSQWLRAKVWIIR